MDSVFAHGEKKNVVHCYRTNELLSAFERYPNKKLTKKNQKDVFNQNIGLSHPSCKMASVHTAPLKSSNVKAGVMKENHSTRNKRKKVKFDICACKDKMIDENYKQKYTPKTWESITHLYGDTDTTEVWVDTKNRPVSIHKRERRNVLPNDVLVTNGDANDYDSFRNTLRKKYKKQKEHDKQVNEQNELDEIELQAKRTSENRDYYTYNTSTFKLLRNNRRNRKEPIEIFKFEKKPRSERIHQDNINNDQSIKQPGNRRIKPTDITCNKGPCVEAAKKDIKSLFCRCDSRVSEPGSVRNECTNVTCKMSRNSLGLNSVIKIKDKLLCICNKYSQKFINFKSYYNVAKEGQCRKAKQHHKYDFTCKCGKNNVVTECFEDTGGKYIKINDNNKTHLRNIDDRLSKRKSPHRQIGSTKLKTLQSTPKQDSTINNIITEHENEQTGEPFFELQVNPKDMCLLNPMEIKEYLKKYGKHGRNDLKCICPSRGILRAGELCATGVCKKAYKNRRTNFNCWCENKIVECGDTTCGIQRLGNRNRKRKHGKNINNNQRHNKPLLEVQLDMNKMCVVNPKEIQEKIINNITVGDACSFGICRDAALKNNIPYYCKCIGRKMNLDLTECAEETCKNPNYKKRSKFCLFCTRIRSKSDNWSSRNRSGHVKRHRRRQVYEISTDKLCRGRICSKSDQLRNDDIHSNHIKHLPACNCRECKANVKSESFSATGEHLNQQKKIEKSSIKNESRHQDGNVNDTNITRMRPKMEEINVIKNDETRNVTCTCVHACECKMHDIKSESKKNKDIEKAKRKKIANKRRSKIISQRQFQKDLKRRTKLDKKREKQAMKIRLKEIKLMRKKLDEEPLDKNFCTAFLLGILKIVLRTAIFIFSIIITMIRDPKGSFWYVRDRITDPGGTFNKFKKWFDDALLIKKLQISETVRGSDTLTILADHFLDTSFYQSFADKGRTKKEQMEFERKSKARKRRIRKREQQAISSCRHTLLTTLRKTPCLWVYHICPNFYPQCLSLLSFMRNFSNILMFLAAFICWTPCIVSVELCRAIMCCFMCTN